MKQLMRNKIQRDITNYYQSGSNEEMSNLTEIKQTILHLMLIKYDMMCDNKKIIQANPEFLTMARMLINENQPDCPIIGVQSLIKL